VLGKQKKGKYRQEKNQEKKVWLKEKIAKHQTEKSHKGN
jgi:hypothetical protein